MPTNDGEQRIVQIPPTPIFHYTTLHYTTQQPLLPLRRLLLLLLRTYTYIPHLDDTTRHDATCYFYFHFCFRFLFLFLSFMFSFMISSVQRSAAISVRFYDVTIPLFECAGR